MGEVAELAATVGRAAVQCACARAGGADLPGQENRRGRAPPDGAHEGVAEVSCAQVPRASAAGCSR